LGIDGECGFSFGVYDNWNPRSPPSEEEMEEDPKLRMRHTFYTKQEWGGLLALLIKAGMLTRVRLPPTSSKFKNET